MWEEKEKRLSGKRQLSLPFNPGALIRFWLWCMKEKYMFSDGFSDFFLRFWDLLSILNLILLRISINRYIDSSAKTPRQTTLHAI